MMMMMAKVMKRMTYSGTFQSFWWQWCSNVCHWCSSLSLLWEALKRVVGCFYIFAISALPSMSFTGAIKGGGLCHLFHFNHHNFLSHSFDIGDCPVLDSNHRTGWLKVRLITVYLFLCWPAAKQNGEVRIFHVVVGWRIIKCWLNLVEQLVTTGKW